MSSAFRLFLSLAPSAPTAPRSDRCGWLGRGTCYRDIPVPIAGCDCPSVSSHEAHDKHDQVSTLLSSSVSPQDSVPKRPKVIVWKSTLIATGLFMVFLMWQCGSGLYQGAHQSKEAVQRFHRQLNEGDFEKICQEADQAFVSANHDQLVRLLWAVRSKLGTASSESLPSVNVTANKGGRFVVVTYDSVFAGGGAKETFTWIKRTSGLKLCGYNISSAVFLLPDKNKPSSSSEFLGKEIAR